MNRTMMNQQPQMLTQVESWSSIVEIANNNIGNNQILMPEIRDFFSNLKNTKINAEETKSSMSDAKLQRLKDQVQELKKKNEETQAKINSYKEKIERYYYYNDQTLNEALDFKIRIMIRQKVPILIHKYKVQAEQKQSNIDEIKKMLNSQSVQNLLANQKNITTQFLNTPFSNEKERIEAISQKVNS